MSAKDVELLREKAADKQFRDFASEERKRAEKEWLDWDRGKFTPPPDTPTPQGET